MFKVTNEYGETAWFKTEIGAERYAQETADKTGLDNRVYEVDLFTLDEEYVKTCYAHDDF